MSHVERSTQTNPIKQLLSNRGQSLRVNVSRSKDGPSTRHFSRLLKCTAGLLSKPGLSKLLCQSVAFFFAYFTPHLLLLPHVPPFNAWPIRKQ